MIKAIIFDCFGVLVGSSFKEIFRQAGGNLALDEPFVDDMLTATNTGHLSVEEVYKQITEHLGISMGEWLRFVNDREKPHLELLDYIKELKPRYKLAILSNANRGVLPRKLNPEQLALFDAVVASADVGYVKPDPEIYQLVADRLGVEPAECVFIDDGPHYCQAAAALGMKTIHYRDFGQFKSELEHILSTPE